MFTSSKKLHLVELPDLHYFFSHDCLKQNLLKKRFISVDPKQMVLKETSHLDFKFLRVHATNLALFHSERPKLYTTLVFLSAIGLRYYGALKPLT